MSETSTTIYTPTRPVPAGVVAHALMALGMHMAEHPELPLWLGLETPTKLRDLDRCLHIHVEPDTIEAWTASLEVLDTGLADLPSYSPFPYRYWVLGTLPNSGVRVQLFMLLQRPQLPAVQS